MLTSVSRPVRTLFLLVLSTVFFGLVVPISPAAAVTITVTASINDTTPEVGQTLTASATFSPTQGNPSAASYKWQSVDGSTVTDIPGATASTYVVTADMITKKLQVVIVSTSGGPNTAGTGTSPQTSPVVAGSFTTQPSVTINDTTPQVDQTVTATATGAVPSAGVTYHYQWYTITGSDPEVLVAGATSATFTAADTDLGKKLLVKAYASKAGYNNSSTVSSAATSAVATATFTTPPSVAVSDTTPQVDQTVTADVTGTSPSSGVTYAYQWYSVTGANPAVLLSGETGATYTVSGSQLGNTLLVKVIASKSGYSSSAEVASAETSAVAAADFTSPPTVTIDDTTPTVGQTLTAEGGDASPSTGTTYSYQWFTVTGSDAPVEIDGATGTTYDVVAADLGLKIVVTKTAHKVGYTPSTATSAESSAVAAADFSIAPTVTIDDTDPVVDETLTATASGEVPTSATYTYQWYSVHGDDDPVAIAGADQSTYLVQAATVGDTIFVRVHAKQAGYNDAIGNSDETSAVAKADFSTAPEVSVDDDSPQVDQVVSAVVDTDAVPSGSYAYQWYTVDGSDPAVEISGADESTYTATADDLGLKLQVKVTANRSGYNDASGTSAETSAVAEADFSTGPQVSVDDSSPTVGDEVSAVVDTDAVPAGTYSYQWFTVDGSDPAVEISGATDDSYTVAPDDAGLALKVRITASRTAYNDASDTSAATDAVAKADFSTDPTVTITGTPKVDVQLTANASGEVPAGSGYTYQWKADDVDIAGATSSTFTPTAAEETAAITVTVTATKTGYNPSGAVTSDPTDAVAKGDFSGDPTVTITGTPEVGEQLTAHASGETPAGSGYTYQWEAGGVDIAGATSSTFTPTADEEGDAITVTVRATKAGYNPSGAATSDPTDVVAKGDFTTDPSVTIDDTTPVVGQTLTANASGSVPSTTTYTYQWKADDVDIASATGATFAPTASELGKTLSVTVKATKAGFNDSGEASSAPTSAVAPAAPSVFTGTLTATLSTTGPKVGDALKVTPAGVTPTPDTYVYQWYKVSLLGVKTPIVGAVGQTYNVPFGALQYKLQAKVTAVKSGYTSVSASSVQTARVNQIILDKSSVGRGQSLKITGKRLRVGQVYRMFIDGKTVYKGKASSTGTAVRTVTVPTSVASGTKRVWVSGYNSAGDRDFTVLTTIVIK